MKQVSVKKLKIPSKLSEIHKVHATLLAAVAAAGYCHETQFAIRLALDEAVANAIRHGNNCDPTKQVMINYEITPDRVTIQVHDEGAGFMPGKVPDCTLDENLAKPFGRGIMLMRAYMTQVDYSDCGCTVTLIKDRKCPLPLPVRRAELG